MVEVIVTVNFKNKNYQTNVIVNKDLSCEKIRLLAEEQVAKQWSM
jgi:predicted transcriptional regulator